jgi:cysteine desulfurase
VGALVVRSDAPLSIGAAGPGSNGAPAPRRWPASRTLARGQTRRAGGQPIRDRLDVLRAIAPRLGCSPGRGGFPTTYISSGREAERVMALDLGLCVSAGSACSSGKVQRSPVLAAMGVEDAVAATAIRISCGWNTESDDIERLIAAWRDLYIRVAQSDISQARAA